MAVPVVEDNMILASDVEACGFWDKVNTYDDIFCLASIDVMTKELYLFHDNPEFDNQVVVDPSTNESHTIPPRTGSKKEGVAFWKAVANKGGSLVVHNAHTYDRPIIDKIFPNNGIPFEAWHDTFNQSKVQWFERPCPKGAKSPHGLQAYGIKLGFPKPPVEDFGVFTPWILHRLIVDCQIQSGTYLMLQQEASTLNTKFGMDFTSALKIEDMYAKEAWEQELRGAKVDVPHILACIAELDGFTDELGNEIEPQLPKTIVKASGKVSRKEMAELFGFDTSKMKEVYVKRKKDGEVVDVVDKPYVRPSMNFHREDKVNQYAGFHITYGESPTYVKKNDLLKWIRETHPDTKSKEWGIEKEVRTTRLLNKKTCEYFGVEETDTDLIAGPHTKLSFKQSTMTQNEVVKRFLIKLGWKYAEEWNLKEDVYGNKIKVEEDTEVRWPANAAPENQLVKKIKKGGFMVSSPKLDESCYEQLPEGLGKKIAEYNTYVHRRRFLSNKKDPDNKGILSYVREDGRLPAGLNNFGTATGRSSHRVWANPAGEKSLYGVNIRKCIVCDEGNLLVGADQKSSQLSIAAYFAKNWEYYQSNASGNEYIEHDDGTKEYIGESAHCHSARNFGIVSHEDFVRAKETQDAALLKEISLKRSFSKGASFGVIFGQGGPALAQALGIPEREGNEKKDNFLRQMGLDEVKDWLMQCKSNYSYGGGFYIPLAFGYWVWCRQDHKAINYLVQGTEALVEKLAEIKINKWLNEKGYNDKAFRVVSYQDECLFECEEGLAEEVGQLAEKGFNWAAAAIHAWYLKNPTMFPNKGIPEFSIKLAGGYDIGKDYSACH